MRDEVADVGPVDKAAEAGRAAADPGLQAVYQRAERVGRRLDAVVDLLVDPARSVDGPLRGTAVAVKDMIDIAGVVPGYGNPRAKAEGRPATTDAPVVARLRAAAADVFATSAMLEYAAGAQHPGLAEARNPHDPGRTAGGSSGGSAALVGAGVCPAALGTDTGGSIRIPAAYCGCVGIKPSFGLVPTGGVQALAPSLDHVGVLAADVATATAVMQVIGRIGTETPPAPSSLRLGVLRADLEDVRVDLDVREALERTIAQLGSAGIELVDVDPTPLHQLMPTFEPILLYEAWRALGPLSTEPDWFGPDTARLLASASGISESDYRHAWEERERRRGPARALVSGVDALIGPAVAFTAPATTPVIDSPDGEREGLFSAPANLTGQPALVLPAGSAAGGLPVGLQLTAPVGADARLLAVARAVEAVLGPGRPPLGRETDRT